MNTYLAKKQGPSAYLENERVLKHCYELLLKDFYIYRATDKMLDVFENEISFYESPHLELSNAIFVYELLNGDFNQETKTDYLRVVFEDSVNDIAMSLSKSFRHGSSIENVTRSLVRILADTLKLKSEEERVEYYASCFFKEFPDIQILNLKDIKKRVALMEASCQ